MFVIGFEIHPRHNGLCVPHAYPTFNMSRKKLWLNLNIKICCQKMCQNVYQDDKLPCWFNDRCIDRIHLLLQCCMWSPCGYWFSSTSGYALSWTSMPQSPAKTISWSIYFRSGHLLIGQYRIFRRHKEHITWTYSMIPTLKVVTTFNVLIHRLILDLEYVYTILTGISTFPVVYGQVECGNPFKRKSYRQLYGHIRKLYYWILVPTLDTIPY